MNNILSIVRSWAYTGKTIYTYEELLEWVQHLNRTVEVSIHKNRLEDSDFWFYDEEQGCIRNKNNSFFQICGIRQNNEGEALEQPIILQKEIGYLGILCKEIDGVLYFLMQAKIEPGNINKIQISPTLQATKSNFTQKHGGNKPAYLDYFVNASDYEIIVDQIQSEQSSRFYKKRNRNIIIKVDDNVEILPSFRWMTLHQIKQLMRIDNLVNMDTRTVLSCIPFYALTGELAKLTEVETLFQDKALFRSIFIGSGDNYLPQIYQAQNNYKMFEDSTSNIIPLSALKNWTMSTSGEFVCDTPYPFKVVFCDIKIDGREVKHWTQPLFQATGIATFGLMMAEHNDIKLFLVKLKPEIGCFDGIELGPTVQTEAEFQNEEDSVTTLFWDKLHTQDGIIFDTLLSEEGGRFYHEQNRNILMETTLEEVGPLPEGYFWVDFKTLNQLVQINNVLNIQLRNLLSLLEA